MSVSSPLRYLAAGAARTWYRRSQAKNRCRWPLASHRRSAALDLRRRRPHLAAAEVREARESWLLALDSVLSKGQPEPVSCPAEAERLVEPVSRLSLSAHPARQLDAFAASISRPLNGTLHERRADSSSPRLGPHYHGRDARYWPRPCDWQLAPDGQQSDQPTPAVSHEHCFIPSGQPLGGFEAIDRIPQLCEQLSDLPGIAGLSFADQHRRAHAHTNEGEGEGVTGSPVGGPPWGSRPAAAGEAPAQSSPVG